MHCIDYCFDETPGAFSLLVLFMRRILKLHNFFLLFFPIRTNMLAQMSLLGSKKTFAFCSQACFIRKVMQHSLKSVNFQPQYTWLPKKKKKEP